MTNDVSQLRARQRLSYRWEPVSTSPPPPSPAGADAEEDQDEDERFKSYWKTLPGILTGVAAILTAVTGLFVAIRATSDGRDKDAGTDRVPPTAVLPSRIANLSVPGTPTWTDTGIDGQPFEEVIITASGTVVAANNQNPPLLVTPVGIESPSLARYSVIREANHAGLIGRIGVSGQPFFVGSGSVFPIPTAGRLFLGVNDTATFNNAGLFTVRVEVKQR